MDDNIFNFIAASELLKPHGFTCHYAPDGKDALPKIQELLSQNIKLDLILMDCEMPIMNGYEATTLLREKMQKGELDYIPIIGLTGNTGKEIEEKCLKSGMSQILTKPLTDPQIALVVGQ